MEANDIGSLIELLSTKKLLQLYTQEYGEGETANLKEILASDPEELPETIQQRLTSLMENNIAEIQQDITTDLISNSSI